MIESVYKYQDICATNAFLTEQLFLIISVSQNNYQPYFSTKYMFKVNNCHELMKPSQ